ncbi:MAG: antitoxin [Actinobacteria bacterium]|nr:antitoxin [Actinomycetota bacterium]
MRTTVAIDDHLLASAKDEARTRGLTLGRLIEEALRHELARRSEPRPAVPVFRGGGGVRPGVDISSNRALYEALDDGRLIEQLR